MEQSRKIWKIHRLVRQRREFVQDRKVEEPFTKEVSRDEMDPGASSQNSETSKGILDIFRLAPPITGPEIWKNRVVL